MIAETRTHLDETRARLAALSHRMANPEGKRARGRPSSAPRLFLELNLVVFLAEYDQAITELIEQRTSLQAMQSALGGPRAQSKGGAV